MLVLPVCITRLRRVKLSTSYLWSVICEFSRVDGRTAQEWSSLIFCSDWFYLFIFCLVGCCLETHSRRSLGVYFGLGVRSGCVYSVKTAWDFSQGSILYLDGEDQNEIGTLGNGLILCLPPSRVHWWMNWVFVFVELVELFCVSDVGSCCYGLDSFEMFFFAFVNNRTVVWGFWYIAQGLLL